MKFVLLVSQTRQVGALLKENRLAELPLLLQLCLIYLFILDHVYCGVF